MNSMQQFSSLFHWRPGLLQSKGAQKTKTRKHGGYFLFLNAFQPPNKQSKSFGESKRLSVECNLWAWNTR